MSHTLQRAGRSQTVLDLAPSLPPIEGDARALNQVFLNLLKNAAEAFEGGHGTHLGPIGPEGNAVVVEIRDDGPGMDPALQQRVFEPFFTTKEAGRGSGLGLSIRRRIVSEHGGELSLESAPGEGSCFRVRLPIAGTRLAAEGAAASERTRRRTTSLRPRPDQLCDHREYPVLYVDDEPENLRIFELTFRREFSILTAS